MKNNSLLLKRKLEMRVEKALQASAADFKIRSTVKNIRINGESRGCSGHFINDATGACVYINTEKSVYSPLSELNLIRYARDEKDFSSNRISYGYNQWARDDELPKRIVAMLQNPPSR